ncbi:DegT/DnrJ/EryC1/StrS family aminotransferase [Rhodobacteraceae bacterium KMM 6894]|nr:DegT/DnrJ/EryC1/StrS family aminotransferase [Rhodobacteraceae bacterium KMM 6894]
MRFANHEETGKIAQGRDGLPPWPKSCPDDHVQTEFPLSIPDIGYVERRNAYQCLRSGLIGPSGPFRDEFEQKFAELVGARHVLSMSNGTTALHLALVLMDVGPGDEVIVPSMTYVATANAVRHTGATPVFADVSPLTWCLDPGDVAARITPRTKGIVPVHLFGNIADVPALQKLADDNGLWVVWDAAHAALSTDNGKGSGAIGKMSAYSFHLNKTITCGEGGALAINDDALFERARMLRSHGMDYHTRFLLHDVGYNYRLSNLHCSVLCGQLDHISAIRKQRADIAAVYDAELADISGLISKPNLPKQTSEVWLYSLMVDPATGALPRDAILSGLSARGVEARAFFPPIHWMPFHTPPNGDAPANLPVTDRMARDGFSLPTHNSLTLDQAREIARRLKQVLAGQPTSPKTFQTAGVA